MSEETSVSKAFSSLQDEIKDLRADGYSIFNINRLLGSKIEKPTVLSISDVEVFDKHRLYSNEGDLEEYQVDLRLQGSEDSGYNNLHIIRLFFDQSYPLSLPSGCYFLSVNAPSSVLRRDGKIPKNVFETIQQQKSEEILNKDGSISYFLYYSLYDIINSLFSIFSVPLHPCVNCNALFSKISEQSRERNGAIAAYQKLMKHPDLFNNSITWKTEWFADSLVNALELEINDNKFLDIFEEIAPEVFKFNMFKPEFCDQLLEELQNYQDSGLPVRRPNSMNNYGVIIDDIGMFEKVIQLQESVLQRVASTLFPFEGAQLDTHHAFMVQYKEGEDLGLDMHVDDSDITFNVCMGKEFTGAGLTFCGSMYKADHRKFSSRYNHVKGWCVVHLGSRRHGADEIKSGERNNLIIWNKNIGYRKSKHISRRTFETETTPPDNVCLSYTHDGDYDKFHTEPKT